MTYEIIERRDTNEICPNCKGKLELIFRQGIFTVIGILLGKCGYSSDVSGWIILSYCNKEAL